jgi:glycosyltransferase involved in cell wall biosynthesis
MFLPLDLTIAIPVKNEEKNLPGCLAAIGSDFAKEIVVIDSGSTDQTQNISGSYGTTFLEFKWNGEFPKKRNWFLRTHNFKTSWVLFLDADEYLTTEFKAELRQVFKNEVALKAGYWLNYTIYFMGKQLRGGYPLKKLALFKISAGEYEKVNEKDWSRLDMEVHEHPILKGVVGKIKSKIDHQDFRGVEHYVLKHNEYSNWEAGRFSKLSENETISGRLTWKQKLKYKLANSILIGPVYFFGNYFMLGGFRDGARGLAFAILKMAYFTEVYCKIKEQAPQKK